MKPFIFIGASQHGQVAAGLISRHLLSRFNIEFSNATDSPGRRYDFAVMIVMKDDVSQTLFLSRSLKYIRSTISDKVVIVAQKGAPGMERLVETSETGGGSIMEFSHATEPEMERVAQMLEDRIVAGEEVLLSSTALAIGYYYNFVLTLLEQVHQNAGLKLNNRWHSCVRLNVIISTQPFSEKSNYAEELYSRYLKEPATVSLPDGRHTLMADSSSRESEPLELYHIPPLLFDIDKSIQHQISVGKITPGTTMRQLKERELSNFHQTLQNLIESDPASRELVNVVMEKVF